MKVLLTAMLSFSLGALACELTHQDDIIHVKLDSHMVKTADFVPAYERDGWESFYR